MSAIHKFLSNSQSKSESVFKKPPLRINRTSVLEDQSFYDKGKELIMNLKKTNQPEQANKVDQADKADKEEQFEQQPTILNTPRTSWNIQL